MPKVLKTDRTYATMPTFHFHGYKMIPYVVGGDGTPPKL